ncbi:thermosome subunit [Candidatus Pacearchaeota archaeon CG09_land_8_20_14_0_10_30_9]|nr:thermosome subunit [Candidatus Pacearchaeota archaeon]OIO40907.1 MAG: thermosome subunit [Candidatus Pacearchaeota archaeon CG1_02_30_18]PIN71587.1 MAG: thermosome subunit [Candidatus Pacearchaeota archaeon CG11_big_fil_rev_8_21_14_0_20_30_13]PIO01079.1 MAG: thermosome subunit [Candidatus Pacearchaeota archaeon CG09_land_8_20_14_0_10_30_9]PIZ81649.1 MAG: thermosome subunit [Candidatus Pacearchaeota archaeon CG_4_10_14_0_2_um_filter_30_11]
MVNKGDFMSENVERTIGRDAQRNNILAAKLVSEVVKTTLGPKGMDKMLVSPTNEIIVTNDGVTILDEMQIEHPAAKMMVEIAKTQEKEVGDGTTTSVMIAGKLLENAEKLLDKKIHPTVIVKGYRIAQEKSQEILKEISLKVSPENEDLLKQIAMTAMTGKGAEDEKERFSEILVRAVKIVQTNNKVDREDVKIEKVVGEGIKDTKLIKGIIIDKERISKDMPQKVFNSKILVIDFPLEIKTPEVDTKISISSHSELQNFLDEEEKSIKHMVEQIISTGCNVLFCQKGIDDFARYLLSKSGVYACRRVGRTDLERISKATDSKIISNLNEINSVELGEAGEVEEIKVSGEPMTYLKNCKNPKLVTILVHGGTKHVVDEIGRALLDGLLDIASALETGLVVPGGGAIEIEIAKRLREFGQTLAGREQLAVEEFANALEFIPITLAENAGIDPIDVLTELKARHDAGEMNAGLNLFTNKVENVLNSKIIEPAKIKVQAINSATDVATMILRIDDVIASKPSKKGRMNDLGRLPDYMESLS